MSTASNSSLKQSCSALTSVTSGLEVLVNVMRSINPRFTNLLTYLQVRITGVPVVSSKGQRLRSPDDRIHVGTRRAEIFACLRDCR